MEDMNKAIDDTNYGMDLVFRDDFDDMANWVNLNPATEWKVEDGCLLGHWAKGGSDVWCKHHFSGDICVELTGKLLEPDKEWIYEHMPEGGKNLNVRFMVTGPDGGSILESYQRLLETKTGLNKMGDDQFNGYFFTLCCKQNRMRRSPGYDNVSEYKDYPLEIGRSSTIRILKTGNRIRYFLGDRKLHDYVDPEPFNEGRIGIALWCSSVAIDKVEVYQVKQGDD